MHVCSRTQDTFGRTQSDINTLIPCGHEVCTFAKKKKNREKEKTFKSWIHLSRPLQLQDVYSAIVTVKKIFWLRKRIYQEVGNLLLLK